MNKAELIDSISSSANLTQKETRVALETLLTEIKKSLILGNRVIIIGFGSWIVYKRNTREGISPQTGKKIKINAKNVVKFKTSSQLIKKLNL